MPKYSQPSPEPTPEVEVAMSILGINAARATVIHSLIKHGVITAKQVEEEYGIPRHTVIRHLSSLEELGVVTTDVPTGEPRNGRLVSFTLHKEPLIAAVEHFERHIDPRRGPTR